MLWQEFSSRIRHFSAADQHDIEHAFRIGEKAHAGQKRQSGEPYFTHPIAVAELLCGMGADKNTVIAALLHDTIEDTNLALGDIEKEFGTGVATMIDGLTKLESKDLEEKPTLNQKIETLRKMFILMQEDIRIMVIKLVDRLHNMQTLSFRKKEKQYAVAKETLDIYVKIADQLCMRTLRDEMEGLCYAIMEPEMYGALTALRMKNENESRAKIQLMEKSIRKFSKDFPATLAYEEKSWEKLRLQHDMGRESPSSRNILNIIFVCKTIGDCYTTLGVLHQLWHRETLTFEDSINAPIINGYKALHTTIILEDGTRIRCKIRTEKMNDYAHRGITLYCFDSKAKGILDYLPWTQRIHPLSEDTEDRSDEFWENLQSDILSESIVVYGSNNQPAVIPKGATALDGALYLYPDVALKITSIRVGGKETPLSHRLENGDFVEVTAGEQKTLQREWLYWVETGAGIAMIRTALANQNQSGLADLGKSIVQKEITERGKGYIEELSEKRMQEIAASLGYDSLNDLFVAVAGRHVDASEVIEKFEKTARNKNGLAPVAKEKCAVHFSVNKDIASIRRLLTVYEKFGTQMSDIRIKFSIGHQLKMKVNIHLSPDDQESYRMALIAAGAEQVRVEPPTKIEFLFMSVVVIAWAMNPVWAKHLLLEGITPLALVSIRSIFFCLFACSMYLLWRRSQGSLFSPIKHAFHLAVLPAISTFILSLLTYLSVSRIAPSVHLTILRFNIILLPLVHLFQERKMRPISLVSSIVTLAACASLMLWLPTGLDPVGIFLALLSLAAYMFYSLVTERTLRKHKIGARHPQFLMHFGLMLGAFGIMLLPFEMKDMSTWQPHLLQTGLYVLFCVFVPHTFFHLVLQRVRFRHITSFSLLEVPLAVIFEISLLSLFLLPLTYVLMLGLLLVIPLFLNRRRIFGITA